MPETISNTSPLQYLYQCGLLDLLPGLFGQLIIPKAVVAEITEGRALGVRLPAIAELRWASIKAPKDPALLPLVADLGPGEREALALALESPGSLVILDDGLARRYAAHLGVRLIGTLGVLLRAKKQRLIPAVAPVLETCESASCSTSGGSKREAKSSRSTSRLPTFSRCSESVKRNQMTAGWLAEAGPLLLSLAAGGVFGILELLQTFGRWIGRYWLNRYTLSIVALNGLTALLVFAFLRYALEIRSGPWLAAITGFTFPTILRSRFTFYRPFSAKGGPVDTEGFSLAVDGFYRQLQSLCYAEVNSQIAADRRLLLDRIRRRFPQPDLTQVLEGGAGCRYPATARHVRP